MGTPGKTGHYEKKVFFCLNHGVLTQLNSENCHVFSPIILSYSLLRVTNKDSKHVYMQDSALC